MVSRALVSTLVASLCLPLGAVPGTSPSPLVFTRTQVSAPVVPGASSVWFHMHADSRRSLAVADFRTDSDGDGWVQWERQASYPAGASIWTVVDLTSGRLMAGEPSGTVPRQSAFPPKVFLRDAAGNFSNLIVDISRMPPAYDYFALLWVRPGSGAWSLSTADTDALTDRDRVQNDLIVLSASSFEPLGDAPTPAGFVAGDLLLGIDAAAEFWFGDKVDDHLNETAGPGTLSMFSRTAVAEQSGAVARTTVLRRDGSDGAVSIRYATQDGTALAGVHYQAVAGTLDFGPGEIVKMIEVPIIDDAVYSGETQFTLQLTDPAGAPVTGASSATVRIIENDPKPVVSVTGSVTRPEGDAGTHEVALEVRLTGGTRLPATVDWTVSPDANAANGGTLTFAPGETQKSILFRYAGDALPGSDRVYTVSITKTQHATAGSPAQVTLVDDDYATLSVIGSSANENHFSANATIRLSAPGRPVTFTYATVDGTAKAGSDYTAVSGTATIPSRSDFASISVPIHRDLLLDEPNETFEVVVTAVSGATVTTDRATITIVNAVPPPPAMVLDNWAGSESSDATFVLRIQPTYQDVTVVATTRAVSAQAGTDFVAKTQTLRIPAGQSSTTFTVDVVDDAVPEGDEVFAVDLTNPVNATFAMHPFAAGSIRDDDSSTPLPALLIEDASRVEGNAGSAAMLVRLRLTSAPSSPVTVQYTTEDGTATAGTDYAGSSGSVTFGVGQMEASISIPVHGDAEGEADETFLVKLLSATGAHFSKSTAVCTIVNDDVVQQPVVPSVTIEDSSVVEGHTESTNMRVRVDLSTAPTSALNVAYTTADLTARGDSDYVAAAGTLTFAPGETSKTILIPVLGDTGFEPDETFTVTLTSAPGATLSDATATCTILNDDDPPKPRRRPSRH